MEPVRSKVKKILIVLMMIALILTGIVAIKQSIDEELKSSSNSELLRSMNYEQFVDGDESVEGTDNVKFSAFFLRDLNGDGYAEQLKGTCKELGKQDTLYMEIIVQTEGYLKDAKISIDNKNFYFQTALPKDNELKRNYIGTNIKTIEFEDLSNGTQKLLIGTIKSGDYTYESTKTAAIGYNTNKYSVNDNKIILTGTYVDDSNNTKEIRKEIDLTVDWYGEVVASIPQYKLNSNYDFRNQDKIIKQGENDVSIEFDILTAETQKKLLLKESKIEMDVPQLNGYEPLSVKATNDNVISSYNSETKILTIEKIAETDGNGIITKNAFDTSINNIRYNEYEIKVVYPLEAYLSLDDEDFRVDFPIRAQYVAYNNPNTDDFDNPLYSNIATSTVSIYAKKYIPEPEEETHNYASGLGVNIGKIAYDPQRYVIDKKPLLNQYNGVIESEDYKDRYTVKWRAYTGTDCNDQGIVLKPVGNDKFIKSDASSIDMGDFVTVKGIYIQGAEKILGTDGYVKVYDDNTNELLHTFISSDWNTYRQTKPFTFDNQAVKSIRIETSETSIEEQSLYVYLIKEIDDNYVLDNILFSDFQKIDFVHTEAEMYYTDTKIAQDYARANYETSTSLAELRIIPNAISNQITEEHQLIQIETISNDSNCREKWTNGTFVVKMPSEIIDLEINDVTTNNSQVGVESYEVIKNEDGIFLQILTKSNIPTIYTITADVNTTADPKLPTLTDNVELYYTNDYCNNYCNSTLDIYDVNGNDLTDDLVGRDTKSLAMISPNALLTAQTASEFDGNGSTAVGPQIAVVTNEQRTAKIELLIKNNQADTISEVVILGRIPSEGSNYVINGRSLESDYSTTITNAGIAIPDEISEYVKVYYSEKIDATRDIENEYNAWTLTPDYSKVKSYMIVLDKYVMPTDVTHRFSYVVNIPEGINYNDVSYSHHAVFYSLDTEEGKYRTQTEPNKLGIMMTQLYDLELEKYQDGAQVLVSGATYKITENGSDSSQARITNSSGKIVLKNLKAEKTYTIKEIRSPEGYKLNNQEIVFTTAVNNNSLVPELISGDLKDGTQIVSEKLDGENYKVKVKVEDEVLAKLRIHKVDTNGNPIDNTRFKLTGNGLGEYGVSLSTNSEGNVETLGLSFGEEYTLTETRAVGYYLNNPIKFKIVKENNNTVVQIVDGSVKSSQIITGEFPIALLEIENEKIPSFNLIINKVKAGDDTIKLQGANFQLIKDENVIGSYATNSSGQIRVNNLLISNDVALAKYTLKEVKAPDGFVKSKDIDIEVRKNGDDLTLITESGVDYSFEGDNLTLTVKDVPTFGLTKVDGTTNAPLPGTKFAIYNVDEEDTPAVDANGNTIGTKEIINGREYYVVTTDAAGQITADFPEGLYKAIEIETSDPKYELSGESYYFGIGASRRGDIVKVMSNPVNFGGSSVDTFYDSVSTNDGGLVGVGNFASSTVSIDDMTFTRVGGVDSLIVKLDSNNEVDWAYSFGNSSDDSFRKVVGLEDDSIIAIGTFSGSITIGENVLTSNGSTDIMIVKFSSTGNLLWAKSFGGGSAEAINSVGMIDGQNFFMAGSFSGTINLNSVSLSNSVTSVYIIEMNGNGIATSGDMLAGTNLVTVSDAKRTKDNGYILNGAFKGTLNAGVNTLVSSGNQSGYLIKLDSDFDPEWGQVFIADTYVYGGSVAQVSDDGYVVGIEARYTTVNIAGSDYACDSDSNFLVKFDKDGNYQWHKYYSSGSGIPYTIALQDGSFASFLKLRSSTNVIDGDSIGSSNIIVCYDMDGNRLWYKAPTAGMSENSNISIFGLKENNLGEILVSGSSARNTIVGIQSNGSEDAFIFKIKDVELVGVELKDYHVIDSTGADEFDTVIATSDGGYIAAGIFRNTITVGDKSYTATSSSYGDVVVVKFDEFSNIEWSNTISGSYSEYVVGIAETSDGYVVEGYTNNYTMYYGAKTLNRSGNSYTNYSVKFDKSGNGVWGFALGGSGYSYPKDIATTKDDGIVAVGYLSAGASIIVNNTTYSSEGQDGYVLKLDSEGNFEWLRIVGGGLSDDLSGVDVAPDGTIYTIGSTNTDAFKVDNVSLETKGYSDGYVLRFDENGNCIWGKIIGGTDADYFYDVAIDNSGNVYVSGRYRSGVIIVDGARTPSAGVGNQQGVLIKLNDKGKGVWAKRFGNEAGVTSCYQTINTTKDNGVIVGGIYSYSKQVDVGNYSIVTRGSDDAVIIKYNGKGEIQYLQDFGGTSADVINDIDELKNGCIVFAGSLQNTWSFGDTTITSNGSTDGIVGRVLIREGVDETSEIVVENTIKKLKITTDVEEIDGVKGGTISGEDVMPYEEVEYGDNSKKEIKMTPNTGYKIVNITVNGEVYNYTAEDDGTYTMPLFTQMDDDIDVVVQYAKVEESIIINKVDKETREGLEGAKFELVQIEDRTDPVNAMGTMFNNGEDYTFVTKGNEVTTFVPTLVDVGSYSFTNLNGGLVPTNGKTYRQSLGETTGISNSTAESVATIDLTGMTGKYCVEVSMTASSQATYDYGFAVMKSSTDAVTSSERSSAFLSVSGNNITTTKESAALEGGNIYYLHVGYYKNGSTDSYNDQVVINNIKLYECEENTTKYYFEDVNGELVSNNNGKDSTVANSCFMIDLSSHTGKYKISMDVLASSESYDVGFVHVTESANAPYYGNQEGRLIRSSGTSNTYQKISKIMDGGKVYYLHIGYYKNASNSSGNDCFKVKNIELTLSDIDLYYGELVTNNEGRIIASIPFGKYEIKEIEAPEGYQLDSTVREINYYENGEHEFTIENERIPKVIVHHYIKNTTTKVAPDEELEGVLGDEYLTSPILDLAKYDLCKDADEEYIFPENYRGVYTRNTIEVTYYYEEIAIPLKVHHFIKGTNDEVPLKDGGRAEDETYLGNEGDNYTTQAIDEELLDEYELDTIPANAKGVYGDDLIEVTYYYGLITRNVTIKKTDLSGTNTLENAVFEIGTGENFETATDIQTKVTDNNGEINLSLGIGKYVVREKVAPSGYTIYEGVKTFEITGDTESINIEFKDDLKKGNVIVHHYIDGTTTPIKDNSNEDVEAEVKQGYLGNNYATKEYADRDIRYKLVRTTGNTSGQYTEEDQEVFYYYRYEELTSSYVVNYIDKDTNLPINTAKNEDDVIVGTSINSSDEVIEINGYNYDSTNIDTLTIKIDESLNVINLYYTKKDNLGYTIYYKEQGTDNEISEAKVVSGKAFKDKLTENAIDIAGYDKVAPTSTQIEVLDGTNEYTFYYTKKDYLGYTIYYKEQGTNLEVSEAKEVTGKTFGDKFTENAVDVVGYNKVLPTSTEIEVLDGTNEYTFYYTKGLFNYTVEYYYDGVKDDSKTDTIEAVYQDEITTYTDKVMDGYIIQKVVEIPLKITADESTNIIKVYYITDNGQLKTLKYTVEYYKDNVKVEDDTIEIQNTVQQLDPDTMTFNRNLINNNDKYDGYKLSKTEPTEVPDVVNDGDIIKVYYVKKNELSYTIHYKEEGTNETLHEDKVVQNQTFGSFVEESAIDIPGYDKVNPSTANIEITRGINEYTFYYKKANYNYTVEYYYDNVIDNDKTDIIEATYLDEIKTYIDKVMTGYKFEKAEGLNLVITANEDTNVIKVYYVTDPDQRKDISYIVEYYKDNVKVGEDTVEKSINVQVLEPDTITLDRNLINDNDKYDGYRLNHTEPANVPDVVNDGDVIKVYYTKIKYPYRVEYYYDGVKEDTATETGEADKDSVIESYENKPKEGYALDEVVRLPLVISDTNENVVKVYYYPIRRIVVNHIEENTNRLLDSDEYEGKSGNTITTSEEDFPGYICVQKPDVEQYTYTEEEQVVNYYYTKLSSGIIEKHIDLLTNRVLSESVIDDGYVGKPYSTTAKDIDGYFVATNGEFYKTEIENNPSYLESKGLTSTDAYIPENHSGQMTEEVIEVKYYYVPEVTLIVKYINIATGEEMTDGNNTSSSETRVDRYGTEYTTEAKTFEGYDLITNKTYYTNYFINHPDELLEENVDEYLTNNNINPSAKYIPANKDGKLEINNVIVTYYYGTVREVIVKYYDLNTNEEISEEAIKVGVDGDRYNVTDMKKELPGYTLVKEPENPEGIYQETNETRKYYYAKNTQVIVKYVDKETGKEIITKEIIEGYVGKDYTTAQKEFLDYYYVSSTDNTEGKMTEKVTEVVYYYNKSGQVTYSTYTVNYIDSETGKPVHTPKTVNNQEIGTTIYAKALIIDIDNYIFDHADKDSITIKDGENIINLYYTKDEDEPLNETTNEPKTEPKVDPDEGSKVEPKTEREDEAKTEQKVEIKDNTTKQNPTVNKVVPKDVVRVSNTGKDTSVYNLIGTILIILGSAIVAVTSFKKKNK